MSIRSGEVAAAALNTMDNQVPYAFVMGNHDLGKNSNKRDSELFNRYFPYDKYSKTRNFGGAFEEGKWIMCGILSRLPD